MLEQRQAWSACSVTWVGAGVRARVGFRFGLDCTVRCVVDPVTNGMVQQGVSMVPFCDGAGTVMRTVLLANKKSYNYN